MQNLVLCAVSWKKRKATKHVSQHKFPAMIQHDTQGTSDS